MIEESVLSRHKVFVSYHHENDQHYKNHFEGLFSSHYDIIDSKSVGDGQINSGIITETIRQQIRDNIIRDASVTVVLIGTETWKRKYVDWEIYSSIGRSTYNSRTGLIGLKYPTRSGWNTASHNPNTIPPRLKDNLDCGFASTLNWTDAPRIV